MSEIQLTETVGVGHDYPLLIIGGPCVIEDLDTCLKVARHLKAACDHRGLGYVFKSSFDKANRTSVESYRGPGMEDGLDILRKVKEEVGVPVLTDIHEEYQAEPVATVVDVIQIPAFLCRQTDLLVAAGVTGLPVHIKKGQFMAPRDMRHAAKKVRSCGNDDVMLCERGSCFGYHELVADMRSIPRMQSTGCPVTFDATHATQRPAAEGDQSGGEPAMAPVLASAAVAAGVDGIFMEAHPEPSEALSDAACMLKLNAVDELLTRLCTIAEAVGAEKCEE